MINPHIVVSVLKESPLSNIDIANATGISTLSISHYRRGIRLPYQANLEKLAAFLGVPEVDREPESEAEVKSESLTPPQIKNFEEIIRKQNETINLLTSIIARLIDTKDCSIDHS